ncbi:unnamed protein product [Arabidopsis halleri]
MSDLTKIASVKLRSATSRVPRRPIFRTGIIIVDKRLK